MKVHLIFPPLWECDAPYASIPYLYAFLKKSGIDVSAVDLNIKIQNAIFSEAFMKETLDQLSVLYSYTEGNKKDIIRKAIMLSKLVSADVIADAKRELKHTFEIQRIIRAKKILEIGRFIYSARFYPSSFNSFQYLINGEEISAISDLLEAVENMDTNIFAKMLGEYVDNIDLKGNIVGISIGSNNQLIPAFTLAKFIKEKNNTTKIIIGGAILPYLRNSIRYSPEIFHYVDYVIIGEGETPLVKLISSIQGELDIDEVPNIFYLSTDNKIKKTNCNSYEDMDTLSAPNFSYVNWDDYFSSSKIFPYLTSRGCYWNQCSFCGLTSNFGQKYRERNIDKVIGDLKELADKYSAKYIIFNDEALMARRIEEISKGLSDNKLNIYWCCLCRLDSTHKEDIFQNAYDMGLRVVSFGLENGSKKVLDLMNKGIDLAVTPRIIKGTSCMGIWNNLYLMLEFPGEDSQDIVSTLNFLTDNHEHIDTLAYGSFRLDGYSNVFKNPREYNVKILPYERDFFGPNYPFTKKNIDEYIHSIEEFENKINYYKFNPKNYDGIDLNMLLVNLSVKKKQNIIQNDIIPMIQHADRMLQIMQAPLGEIYVKAEAMQYQKATIGEHYSYIFYSPKKGISIELMGDLEQLIRCLDEWVSMKKICEIYCDYYHAGMAQIESFIRQIVYHLYRIYIVNMKIEIVERSDGNE